MAYTRDKGPFVTSLALIRFRQDQSQLSHFYWVGVAESDLFSFTIKKFPETDDPMVSLTAPVKFERRLGHDVRELKSRVKTEVRWRRLVTVLLMASALERFLLSVATSAVSSDPTLTPGFPKRVDGAILKKYGLRVERPNLQGLVKGTWSSRLATYRRLFGSVPPQLFAVESKLEKLRQVRNRIAHDFGFDATGLEPHINVVLGARRAESLSAHQANIGDKTIMSWMQAIGAASTAIDAHLFREFIGGYEPVELFLSWRPDPDGFEAAADIEMVAVKKSDELNRFGTMLGTLLDRPIGSSAVRSMRDFVDAL